MKTNSAHTRLTIGAIALIALTKPVFAEPPTTPGQPFGSVSGSTIAMDWIASSNEGGVEGYNIYRNNRYVSTVPGTQYAGPVNTSESNVFYVVAFGAQSEDGTREFSPRSPEQIFDATIAEPPSDEVDAPDASENSNTSDNTDTSDTQEAQDTQRPAIVQGIQASLGDDGSVVLRWAPGADNVGVDGYNVYRNGNYLTTLFTTSFIDNDAPTNQDNRYAVAAFDKVRNFGITSNYVVAENDQPPVASNNGTPPILREPNAAPVETPLPSDPFGSLLEIDNETAVAGGPPTQPKHLRAELVSNDWAEINWAPSNDDGEVVEYRIYRSDGVVYTVREDQLLPNANNQAEINRFWYSTLFIDCNYTRFSQLVHNCMENSPTAGAEYIYEVSAIDNEGLESARSEPLEVIYHLPQNAPIPNYNDFYKAVDDRFVQEHDLSRVAFFIDDFLPVFTEEFDATQINSDYWNTGLVWGDAQIINGEQQYFVDTQAQPNFGYDPFKLTGDTLIIESIPTPADLEDSLPDVCDTDDALGKDRCAFLSGALSSHDKFGLTYGYVESRMKVGSAAGSLSSFYLYNRYPGTGRKLHRPEIDIVEYLGENPFGDELAFQTYHYANVNDGSTNSAPTMSFANPDGTKYDEDFHTFGVLWEPQLVIWYIDGQEIKRMTGPQVSRQQMNLVTYLVSGSSWAPTPDASADIYPLQFEIDYIKAYQRNPFNTNGLYPD